MRSSIVSTKFMLGCFVALAALPQSAPAAAEAAVAACTGSSTKLPAAQCAAWQAFHDSTGGDGWKVCKSKRNDPCACQRGDDDEYADLVCNKAGTAVLKMCVSARACTPPPLALAPAPPSLTLPPPRPRPAPRAAPWKRTTSSAPSQTRSAPGST